jgi:imidazolonepropionase
MGLLWIQNLSEVITCHADRPKKGADMQDIGRMTGVEILIQEDKILAIAPRADLQAQYDLKGAEIYDAGGCTALPGFVDSHTHLVWGGDRAEEFSWRLSGMDYMEIMDRGGGIAATVEQTRQASEQALIEAAAKRLDSMLRMGVTTVEAKSGYGLNLETELKQLRAAEILHARHPVDLVLTYMAAHDIPKGVEKISYIQSILDEMGAVKAKSKAQFFDVFCEKNVFEVEESERLLAAAREAGFYLKLHADEIVPLGGAELAVAMRATSADHLLRVSDAGIRALAESETIATLLPGTAFSLQADYAPARRLIDAGCAVALASDLNPGSCHSESIPLIIALSCLKMKMSVEEVITALTINGAAALNRLDTIGSLAPGKQADLVILDADTYFHLIYHLGVNTVNTVVKKGRIVVERDY